MKLLREFAYVGDDGQISLAAVIIVKAPLCFRKRDFFSIVSGVLFENRSCFLREDSTSAIGVVMLISKNVFFFPRNQALFLKYVHQFFCAHHTASKPFHAKDNRCRGRKVTHRDIYPCTHLAGDRQP